MIPRQNEISEVGATREGQQSTGDRCDSSLHMKLKRPSKSGWGWGLGGSRRLILFGIVDFAGGHLVVNDHSQVLKKGGMKG